MSGDWKDTAGDFAGAAGRGAWDAAKSAGEGVVDMAKGGYDLATDAAARERAMQTAKELAHKAKDYADYARHNPRKAFDEAKAGALALYSSFDKKRAAAAAEGKLAEFWGEIAGKGGFEIGSLLIPIGALSKAGKLGKFGKLGEVGEIGKIGRTAGTIGEVVDEAAEAAKAGNKAGLIKAGAMAPRARIGLTGCPIKDAQRLLGSSSAAARALDDMAQINALVAKGDVAGARAILKPFVDNGQWEEVVARLDVGTGGKPGYLWSGNKAAAAKAAQDRGGMILEGTKGGKILDDWDVLKSITWDGPNGANKLWALASEKYAAGLEGETVAIMTKAKDALNGGDNFRNFELPTIRDRIKDGAPVKLPKIEVIDP